MTSSERAKRAFDEALKIREARIAILIEEHIRNGWDIIDEQPTAVLELLIERGKSLQLPGASPEHRHKLRNAFIEYLEERLLEARERERQLAHAITGAENLPGD
jgi:hypothetical protein